jgi:hypothetical protein
LLLWRNIHYPSKIDNVSNLGQVSLQFTSVLETGTATGYGLEDRGAGVRVPVESRIFSSPCRSYPISYPKGVSGSFPRD